MGCREKGLGFLPELNSAEPYLPLQFMQTKFAKENGYIFSLPITGDEGYLLAIALAQKENFLAQLYARCENQFTPVDTLADLKDLRVEAGFSLMGIDFDESTLVQELNMGERLINMEKGCFPGQEIVARIHSRGAVKQKLMGLKFDQSLSLPDNAILFADGKEAVFMRSQGNLFNEQKNAALAFVKKPYYENLGKIRLTWGDHDFDAEICALPMYISSEVSKGARTFYDRGLGFYHMGQFSAAQCEFSKAIHINREFGDAYEAMAMAFEQSGDIEKAIFWNKKYSACDPLAVMAQTNLSRLYMKQGLKDLAEAAQMQATVLKFKAGAQKKGSPENTRADIQAKADAEKNRKISLFTEVLAIDPEDEIANFALGKVRLEENKIEEAISHLNSVVRVNPHHSLTYELLGRALWAKGDLSLAMDTLQKGIAVAKENGDLMPLKNMEQLMKANASPDGSSDTHSTVKPR
jgi:folate-binding protein YgfZ